MFWGNDTASSIVVSGSLRQIAAKLRRIKEVTANRKAEGYPIFTHISEWRYVTADDDRVCVGCNGMNGEFFRGDYVQGTFQYSVTQNSRTVKPHAHSPRDEHCRCTLKWVNSHEVCVELLRRELEEAAA